MPRPSWIHTVAAAASIGWLDQMVTPLFTACCTHTGEVAADGWTTPEGSPKGIPDCSCKSPSRIHRRAKPTRTTRLAGGSAAVVRRVLGKVRPCSFSRRYWAVRTMLKPIAHSATTSRTTSNWWKSAV